MECLSILDRDAANFTGSYPPDDLPDFAFIGFRQISAERKKSPSWHRDERFIANPRQR